MNRVRKSYLREGVETFVDPNNECAGIHNLKKIEVLLSRDIAEIENLGSVDKDIAEVMKLHINT